MILLDTHVLLWLRQGNSKLGTQTRKQIDRAFQANELAVCSISFWEIAMLIEKGRIRLITDLSAWRNDLISQGLGEIVIDGEIGIKAANLTNFHPDPADRFIVSSCLVKGASLATADQAILDWNGHLNRIDARL